MPGGVPWLSGDAARLSGAGGEIDRRAFILGAAALVASGAAAVYGIRFVRDVDPADGAASVLDLETARWVAEAYVEARPDESSPEVAGQRLFGGEAPTQAGFGDALLERALADYAAGRVVDVHGWVASEAEGRLAVLAVAGHA